MKRNLMIAAALVCFLAAAAATAFPVLSSHYAEKHRSEIRTAYYQAVDALDTSELEAARKAAQAYNTMLANGVIRQDSPFSDSSLNAAMRGYEELLNAGADGIMAYVEIPKLGLYLPVGHGTEAETLEHAVGHVIGTSLPVGGESSHSVLSGHSGLATDKMFSDLDQLAEGDSFYIHVLNETLAYKVDQVSVVLPSDTSRLSVIRGRDYVTLITCTPIGVNTHRLLVRGERTAYAPPEENQAPAQETPATASTWSCEYIRGLSVGVALLLLLALLSYARRNAAGKRGRHG